MASGGDLLLTMETTHSEFKGFQLNKDSDGELQRNLNEAWRQLQGNRET